MKKIKGTKDRPRLAVFRSNKYIYVQLIDDEVGKTLAAASGKKSDVVGKEIAAKASKLRIKKVVFDRGGFLYHGRVAGVAQGAREGGLEF